MMKSIALSVVFVLISYLASSQQTKMNAADSLSYTTIDEVVSNLYEVISGDKDEERDWAKFKNLFYNKAKLIPTGKTSDTTYISKHLTPEDYIKTSGKWLVENGFYEVELFRKTESFGHIAQVFSTYASYKSKNDEQPFMRGINSIQLMNDGKRWYIVNIMWMQETERQPIPDKYLPIEN